jgi:hypothetical protein
MQANRTKTETMAAKSGWQRCEYRDETRKRERAKTRKEGWKGIRAAMIPSSLFRVFVLSRFRDCPISLPRCLKIVVFSTLSLLLLAFGSVASAAKVTVDLGDAQGVTYVGAFNRWDMDGNHRRPVNPKAKIDVPEVDAIATKAGDGQWVFKDLKPGEYDLVIMGPGKVRIEGWTYAPVEEFDPFFPPDATIDDEVRQWIDKDIRNSRHYENKLVPLHMGGDDKVARILVMLIRDKPTSYESEMPGAATMRFEIWQYTWKYGGWVKERRTQVLHRVILPRDELRQWTWVWDPKLGGIKVKDSPLTIQYEPPKPGDRKLQGLYPY